MKPVMCSLIAAALCAAGAAHAGTVAVSFIEPANYYDVGVNDVSRADNLRVLNQAFSRLAGRLPADATLKVDVLDVDLAGRVVPRSITHGTYDVRVAWPTDWPRMHLRYSLEVNGVVRRSGDEWIKYQDFVGAISTPLRAEQLMVAHWFDERFASEVHAGR